MSEKATYEVGKGKPPVNRRFGQPDGNPNGKTKEQKRLEMANAEKAMAIRERLLDALHGVMLEDPTKETLIDRFLKNEVLKLLKDSEDRGLGAPVQALDHTTNGKDMPAPVDLSKLSDAALAELIAARDAAGRD